MTEHVTIFYYNKADKGPAMLAPSAKEQNKEGKGEVDRTCVLCNS